MVAPMMARMIRLSFRSFAQLNLLLREILELSCVLRQFAGWGRVTGALVIQLAVLSCCVVVSLELIHGAEAPTPVAIRLEPRSRVVIIGNTLAERMQYYGYWESLLHQRFPQLRVTVRPRLITVC